MRKTTIFRLFLLIIFTIPLYSCIHDDISSSSNPSSTEYTNKSLWKEDEKYIQNVMRIYQKNEYKIKNIDGKPYWNYATTIGSFDESFLMVPIVDDNKVVSVLQVSRNGNYVSFNYTQYENHNIFFQRLVFAKLKKALIANDMNSKGGCVRQWISVWMPDNQSNPDGQGHWESSSVIKCYTMASECIGVVGPNGECTGGGGGDNYPYPGGGGGANEPQTSNQDIISELQGYPCAQNLVQQLPDLTNDIAAAMKQIFQNNKNYNIVFKPKSNLGDVDGVTFTSSVSTGSFNATINLNDQILTNATKEYILITMYHEVIHAFLSAEKSRLGESVFHDQYPSVIIGYDYDSSGNVINRFTFLSGHQQLGPFLTTLQNILSSYNPNLPQDVIKAMAKTGISTTTSEENILNLNERNTLLGKQKGTKCP